MALSLTAHLRFGAAFLGLFVLFQAAYYALPDTWLHALIHHGVVDVAAAAINLLSPGEPAMAAGRRLVSHATALEVIRGCDGSGAAFMLIAAVVALGASSWQRLLAGVLGAALLMYVVNELRIIALYYVLANWPARFDDVHELAAPLVVIVVSTACFLAWALYAAGGAGRGGATGDETGDNVPGATRDGAGQTGTGAATAPTTSRPPDSGKAPAAHPPAAGRSRARGGRSAGTRRRR